jgi:hypothetical protein
MEQHPLGASQLTPVVLMGLLVSVFLVCCLPRRFTICPLLATACLMPLGQAFVVFGLHFPLFRVLLLAGVLRVLLKRENIGVPIGRLDKVFLAWVLVMVVFGSLSKPSFALLQNRLGLAYNAVCCYFFVRCVVRDLDDIVIAVRALALLSVPMAVLMLIEHQTSHNLLAVFGGVPEVTAIREGRLRCQGAFRHPILAGTLGASEFPLFLGLWLYRPQYRGVVVAGMISAVAIVLTSASSGPLLALVAGIAGWALWKFRSYMRLFRRGTLVVILALAVVMKAPVWYLLGRIDIVPGNTGWHRAYLIDQAVSHLNEWWLFGTTYTAHWGPGGQVLAADPDNMDITNHFVAQGVNGGLLGLVLFVAMVVCCFRIVGRRVKEEAAEGSAAGLLIWSLGVTLFVHCVSFISISYFDQIIVFFYWLLSGISSADRVRNRDVFRPEAGEWDNKDCFGPCAVLKPPSQFAWGAVSHCWTNPGSE